VAAATPATVQFDRREGRVRLRFTKAGFAPQERTYDLAAVAAGEVLGEVQLKPAGRLRPRTRTVAGAQTKSQTTVSVGGSGLKDPYAPKR
jgi:hypothetical protein